MKLAKAGPLSTLGVSNVESFETLTSRLVCRSLSRSRLSPGAPRYCHLSFSSSCCRRRNETDVRLVLSDFVNPIRSGNIVKLFKGGFRTSKKLGLRDLPPPRVLNARLASNILVPSVSCSASFAQNRPIIPSRKRRIHDLGFRSLLFLYNNQFYSTQIPARIDNNRLISVCKDFNFLCKLSPGEKSGWGYRFAMNEVNHHGFAVEASDNSRSSSGIDGGSSQSESVPLKVAVVNGVPLKEADRGGGLSSKEKANSRADKLRALFGKSDGDPLRIVGVGAGAWGSVFLAQLQETYGSLENKVDVKIWRRAGKKLDKEFALKLFKVINENEDVLRRLIRNCAYLKYVEARLGDRTLCADEILRDGFCVNLFDTPLCPLTVVTNLQEAVWDADIVVNGLPSTETRAVFREIGRIWRERQKPPPVIISLAKGVEAGMDPEPHIVTPTLMIHQETGVPMDNVLYLGGPNIAAEIYHKEYANARLCGSLMWRKPVAAFLRQPHFIVWDNGDLVTHEVMGGLKNVYAIGAGLVAALTGESATSKSVYFAHATSEMIFVTRLISDQPERLAGPLLADTYVTLLKGRNAWYGQQLAKGDLTPAMGDVVPGRGLIQGVSAVEAFHKVLSQPMFQVPHPTTNEMVPPVELCPILKCLYKILFERVAAPNSILDTLRDENMYDPGDRIAVAPEKCYLSKLLGKHPSMKK